MDQEFQPLYEEKDSEAFDIWDIKAPEPEPIVEIDEKEEFAKECEGLRKEAKEAGYQEGLRQAAEHIQQKQQQLVQWINLLRQPITLIDNALNKEIVQTILWVCEACIGFELSIHPEKLLALVEEIKRELPSLQGNKQLSMNPLDVECIINDLNELKDSKATGLTDILVADPTLARGDFYLKTEYNDLDGRLKTRLEKLFKSYLTDDESLDQPKANDSI